MLTREPTESESTALDTVQGRVSGPEEMLTALGHQTLGRWETLSPSQLIPVRGLLTACAIGLVTALIAGGFFSAGGDTTIAMQRALGAEIPYITIIVQPRNDRILEGLPVVVSLELAGRTNRDVLLRHRSLPLLPVTDADEEYEIEWTEVELLPITPEVGAAVDSRRAFFELGLGKALQPIEYQFVTSIGATDIYRIDVQPLIELQRIESVVRPPAYTKLEERSFTTRDLNVLENSLVTVTIETNHPLGEVVLEVGARPSDLKPVGIAAGDDSTRWAFVLPSTDSLHWKFSGNGNDGTPMKPVKGKLRIRRDGAPKVAWHDPGEEIMVHTLAEVPMRVQIADCRRLWH